MRLDFAKKLGVFELGKLYIDNKFINVYKVGLIDREVFLLELLIRRAALS